MKRHFRRLFSVATSGIKGLGLLMIIVVSMGVNRVEAKDEPKEAALIRNPLTRGKFQALVIHSCEAAQRAHPLAKTPAFAISQRALIGKWSILRRARNRST